MGLVGWWVVAEGHVPTLFDAPSKEAEPLRVMRYAYRALTHWSHAWLHLVHGV